MGSSGSEGKESACSAGDPGLIPESGRSPGEGDAVRSSVLVQRIPRTEDRRVGHSWATNACTFTLTWRRICSLLSFLCSFLASVIFPDSWASSLQLPALWLLSCAFAVLAVVASDCSHRSSGAELYPHPDPLRNRPLLPFAVAARFAFTCNVGTQHGLCLSGSFVLKELDKG